MVEIPQPTDPLASEEGAVMINERKKGLRHWFKRRKKWQKVLLGIFGLFVAGGLFLGGKALLATKRIFTATGSAPAITGDTSPARLRKEGDGRINILLLGVGGEGHAGGDLSDSIMVVSIDPKTKTAAALSIPRDLYVPIGPNNKYGHAKINAAHAYGEQEDYPGGGPALAKQTIENLLDLPIHYYVRADFYGFKQAVDAVGGIDITVDKRLYDPYYPKSEAGGYIVLNVVPGRQHMNGDLALKFARSRETTSDFDRAARQQKLLAALKDKVFSLGTLSNPSKISKLIDTVGSHVRTDLSFNDLKQLIKITKDIDGNAAPRKVLDTSEAGLLEFGNVAGAGSIEVPAAGIDNFLDIQILTHTLFPDGFIKDEAASVEVENGTFHSGLATQVSKQLKGYGYNVVATSTADRQSYKQSVVYDYSGGKKPYTINYLERRFGVKAIRAPKPAGGTADIVVVVGSNYEL